METFSAPTNMISSINVKKKMSFILEAEDALLINFSEDCKYMHLYLGSVLGFLSNKKPYTLEDTFYLENKRHKS